MSSKFLLPLLCSFLLATASPVPDGLPRSGYAVKERHPIPPQWRDNGPAPKDHSVQLHVGLKQGGDITAHLLEISDPSHGRYGKHLKRSEIADIVRPSAETRSAVEAWLNDNGIDYSYTASGDWIQAAMTIGAAEQLLQTTYSSYTHEDGLSTVFRTSEWSLPHNLHDHIDVVQPTTAFVRENSHESLLEAGEARKRDGIVDVADIDERDDSDAISKVCHKNNITPKCVRTLYGTIDVRTSRILYNEEILANT
jgi:tripeptidyl-peptidase I